MPPIIKKKKLTPSLAAPLLLSSSVLFAPQVFAAPTANPDNTSAPITVTVIGGTSATDPYPQANDDTAQTTQGNPITISPLWNDTGTELSITVVDGVSIPCTYDPQRLKQDCAAEDASFGGSDVQIGALPTNQDGLLGSGCKTLHDRYWTIADDGKAYRTWHPPTDGSCTFGHEHGDDPRTSKMIQAQDGSVDSTKLEYIGGFPPFGFAASNHDQLQSEDKHEDHVGHKIVVANDLQMAFGNPPGSNSDGGVKYSDNLLYAGFNCHWLSKIHQGTHSSDAIRNNVHEYFLNVDCNDQQQAQSTKFSVKKMVLWGALDTIQEASAPGINGSGFSTGAGLSLPGDSMIRLPNNLGDNGDGPKLGREFIPADSGANPWQIWGDSINNFSYMKVTELWRSSLPEQIKTLGGGGIKFNPYYIAFNPSRVYSPRADTPDIIRTTEACQGVSTATGFCSAYNGEAWDSADSPFNGAVRAVHFKGLQLQNSGVDSQEVFCTDADGGLPKQVNADLSCPAGSPIKQRAHTISNFWSSQANPEFCITTSGAFGSPNDASQCVGINIEGTLTKSKLWRSNGEWKVDIDKRDNNPGFLQQFDKPQQIGYEWISNHGNDVGVRAPN